MNGFIKGKGSETVKPNQAETIFKTKLFVANFVDVRRSTRKLFKIENLETSSWEPESQ